MNETLQIIGNVIGALAVVEVIFLFISLRRDRILLFKLINDILWTLSYICLGLSTGAVLNFIGIGREFIYGKREKGGIWAKHFWLWLFLVITLLTAPLSWEGMISILPVIGSMLEVVAFYSNKPSHMRILCFAAQFLWGAYAVIGGNYASAACCVLQVVSIIIGTVRELEEKKHQTNLHIDGD